MQSQRNLHLGRGGTSGNIIKLFAQIFYQVEGATVTKILKGTADFVITYKIALIRIGSAHQGGEEKGHIHLNSLFYRTFFIAQAQMHVQMHATDAYAAVIGHRRYRIQCGGRIIHRRITDTEPPNCKQNLAFLHTLTTLHRMNTVFINGQLVSRNVACVSVEERGFRFGDGVFETIPVHQGIPYLLPYHLERLQAGLDALGIAYDVPALPDIIQNVITVNGAQQAVARVYISRGIGSQGYLPTLPASAPTSVVQLLSLPLQPTEPIALWLSQWEKISPRALPTHCKLAQGLNATLARMEAREQGCYEALQISPSGMVSEASSANIFWLKDDVLHTPPLSTGALAGVTRRRLLERGPYPARESEITPAELAQADAVFLTNATMGIAAVESVQPLGLKWDTSSALQTLTKWRIRDIEQYSR